MGCTQGEHKTLQLADGSQVLLHKASTLNIAFSSVERRIRLQDLITTAKGSDPRPFVVQTPHSTAGLRPLPQVRRGTVQPRVRSHCIKPLRGAALGTSLIRAWALCKRWSSIACMASPMSRRASRQGLR